MPDVTRLRLDKRKLFVIEAPGGLGTRIAPTLLKEAGVFMRTSEAP